MSQARSARAINGEKNGGTISSRTAQANEVNKIHVLYLLYSTTAPFNHCVVLFPSQKQRKRTFIGLLQTRKNDTHIDIYRDFLVGPVFFRENILCLACHATLSCLSLCVKKLVKLLAGRTGKYRPLIDQ